MQIVRSWAFVLFLYLSAIVIGVLCLPSLIKRSWAMRVAKAWCELQLAALRVLCGVKSDLTGLENLPPAPLLIASNHQSMWETIALAAALPRPCFILKKELSYIPIFGWWCARSGFVFVDRRAGAKALRLMLEDARAAVKDGAQHLIIFPEGTRSGLGEEKPFQPGVAALAKSLAIPVVPAAHNSGAFWLHPGPLKCPGTITLRFLPPVDPTLTRATLLQTLQTAIGPEVRALEAAAASERETR